MIFSYVYTFQNDFMGRLFSFKNTHNQQAYFKNGWNSNFFSPEVDAYCRKSEPVCRIELIDFIENEKIS